MTKKEIKGKAYNYGMDLGYAICEEMVGCLGYDREKFISNGYRGGYIESEGTIEAILEDEWSEENENKLDFNDVYRGINRAFREFWGVRKVSSKSRRYDLCVIAE